MSKLVGGPWNGREMEIPSYRRSRYDVWVEPAREAAYSADGLAYPIQHMTSPGHYERVPLSSGETVWVWHERYQEMMRQERTAQGYEAESQQTSEDADHLRSVMLASMARDLMADARSARAECERLLRPDPDPNAADWDQLRQVCHTCQETGEVIRRRGCCRCRVTEQAVREWQEMLRLQRVTLPPSIDSITGSV